MASSHPPLGAMHADNCPSLHPHSSDEEYKSVFAAHPRPSPPLYSTNLGADHTTSRNKQSYTSPTPPSPRTTTSQRAPVNRLYVCPYFPPFPTPFLPIHTPFCKMTKLTLCRPLFPQPLTGEILQHHYCFSPGAKHGYNDEDIRDKAHEFCYEDTEQGALDPEDEDGRDTSRWLTSSLTSALEIAVFRVTDCIPEPEEEGEGEGQAYSCEDLVFGAWKQCYGNGGRGGAVDSKCLRYSVRPYWKDLLDLLDLDGPTGADWLFTNKDKDIIDGVNFDI